MSLRRPEAASEVEGKVIPVQARTGNYGSRTFRFTEFLDIQNTKVGRLSVLHIGRFLSQEISLVLFLLRAV